MLCYLYVLLFLWAFTFMLLSIWWQFLYVLSELWKKTCYSPFIKGKASIWALSPGLEVGFIPVSVIWKEKRRTFLLSYFRTLSIGLATGIEPATSRSAGQHSSYRANPYRSRTWAFLSIREVNWLLKNSKLNKNWERHTRTYFAVSSVESFNRLNSFVTVSCLVLTSSFLKNKQTKNIRSRTCKNKTS